MQKNVKGCLASLIITSLMVGCHDKKDDVAPGETIKFKDKKWQTVSVTIDPGYDFDKDGKLETDITKLIAEPCEIDDIMTFQSDQKISYDEGATKCDPSDPQTTTDGTWSFDNATKMLTEQDADGVKTSYKVVLDDGENLKLADSEMLDKVEYKMTWHLKHVK